MEERITVMTFDTITRLAIVQAYLEAEGIECFVKDEFMGTIYSAVGINELRIKLQVKKSDADEAIGLLVDAGYARLEDYMPDQTMLKISRYFEKIMNFFKRKERR